MILKTETENGGKILGVPSGCASQHRRAGAALLPLSSGKEVYE